MEFTELLMIFSAVALALLYGWVLLWSCRFGVVCTGLAGFGEPQAAEPARGEFPDAAK